MEHVRSSEVLPPQYLTQTEVASIFKQVFMLCVRRCNAPRTTIALLVSMDTKQPRQNLPCYELNAQIKRNALRLFVQRDIRRLAGQSNKGCSGGEYTGKEPRAVPEKCYAVGCRIYSIASC